MPYIITLFSLQDTQKFAQKIAPHLPQQGVITLTGEMGSGKTSFTKALIEALYALKNLEAPPITSPTFSLIHLYDINGQEIAHCDLYRLSSVDELVEIGLDDAFDTAVCLIEWPDRLGDTAPSDAVTFSFAVTPSDGRRLTITGSAQWLEGLLQ